jgi:hypothetical protein
LGAFEGFGGRAGGKVDDLLSKGHRVVETLHDRVAVAGDGSANVRAMGWRRAHTRYFQTAGTTALASIIASGLADRRTHILEAEELVAAITA